MSAMNAFTHQRSLNIRWVALIAQVHSVTPLPINNLLSHENNNWCLLEKAITFKRKRFFITPTYTLQISHRMVSNLTGSFSM